MRIVFTPWGSLGDLHPYLAVAIEMRRRGHAVTVATSELYREKVTGEGLGFHAVRPDMRPYLDRPDLMAGVMHPFKGPERIFRGILAPSLPDMFVDLRDAAAGADLLVSHAAMLATPLVAELLSIPWISVVLQPALFWSAYDPPYFPLTGNWLRSSRWLAHEFFRLVRRTTENWVRPVYALRRELGLAVKGKHPLFEGQYSPWGTLAFFSPQIAAPQPDWPANVTITGFPFYDKLYPDVSGLSDGIREFLEQGDPPAVFTLGSSAVNVESDFYAVSERAVRAMGIRAIFLAGLEFERRKSLRSTKNIFVAEYAPYSQLFPKAAITVHSGGIGTTAQALRAGKPTVVMPFSHDQPDNGARVRRLGTGTSIPRWRYTERRLRLVLSDLLTNQTVQRKAAEIGKCIDREDGISAAADALERLGSQPTA